MDICTASGSPQATDLAAAIRARRILEEYRATLNGPFFRDIDQDSGFGTVAVA